MRKPIRNFLVGYSVGLLGVFLIFTLVTVAHCAVATKHANSLGVPMYTENPYMYQAGSLTEHDAAVIVDGNLNLRIHPVGTYMLYEESLLVCGRTVDKFTDVTEPFVLTYERKAHRTVNGIACHNLVQVDSLKPKETTGQ